jgi:uncharacterized protein with von Willebrand factor type A (vWA) domain
MPGVLIEDYKNLVYRSQARAVLTNFLLQNKKLPFFVALDASIIHLKPWSSIVFNPRVKSSWKSILERYYESVAYKALNEAVAGDPLLAKYATIQWLNTLFQIFKKESVRLRVEPKDGDYVQALLKALDTQVSPAEASKVASHIAKALEAEAEEIRRDLEAEESFSHIGLPVAELLEKPDEFRLKARNRIIVNLVRFLRMLRREASAPKIARAPTVLGGRPLGIKRLERLHELTCLLPTEFLDDDLLAYRLASRSALVRERYGGLPNYVVYLDKSGSMAEDILYRSSPTQREYVPKISFAAASALALAYKLKQVGSKMTLKLFDTEVHDPIEDIKALIDTLLRISADGGTNISNVLQDAVKHHRDSKVVVVTDGIDEVSEDAVKAAKSASLDAHFVFIKTDNPLLKSNFPCTRIEEAKPDILLSL